MKCYEFPSDLLPHHRLCQDLFELTNRIGRLSGFAPRVRQLMLGLGSRPPVLNEEIAKAQRGSLTKLNALSDIHELLSMAVDTLRTPSDVLIRGVFLVLLGQGVLVLLRTRLRSVPSGVQERPPPEVRARHLTRNARQPR